MSLLGSVKDAIEHLIDRGLIALTESLHVSYFAKREQAFVHLGRVNKIGWSELAEVQEDIVLGTPSHTMHLMIKPALGLPGVSTASI